MKTAEHPILPVLLIDDEESWLYSFSITLRSAGINNILTCGDSREVMQMLEAQSVGTIVLDLTMPHVSGQELLARITQEHPEIPVVIVTGADDLTTAISCMKHGAFDYFVKTVETERLLGGIGRAVEMRQLRQERDHLKERFLENNLENPDVFAGIVTDSNKVRSIFRYLETVAPSTEPVLITGETGVGKELFARAVHELSRSDREFVAVNAAGLDDHVFSDTLFGHKKGAFTGADSTRAGLVERAEGGTLFLDEVGDLPMSAQVKLLRLIQEHEYYPLGSDVSKKSDARIVVATNRDIVVMTEAGEFRRDLFYRLGTHCVEVPPLRERKEDLPVLLERFLEETAAELGKRKPTVPRELLTLLAMHTYPGNVRELKSMVYEAVTLHASGILSMDVFKKHMRGRSVIPEVELNEDTAAEDSPISFSETLPTLKEGTEILIAEAMRRSEGNQTMAADLLGMSRQALNKRLRQASSEGEEDPA